MGVSLPTLHLTLPLQLMGGANILMRHQESLPDGTYSVGIGSLIGPPFARESS